jgi:hypothetical protein
VVKGCHGDGDDNGYGDDAYLNNSRDHYGDKDACGDDFDDVDSQGDDFVVIEMTAMV